MGSGASSYFAAPVFPCIPDRDRQHGRPRPDLTDRRAGGP